ncbi:outer membrane protein [Helicobacter labacensis]|uniref:outer membrane protein n=1 Tax=Helicobacter labacensis TaxID=2316079 RepID=UPI000EB43E7B|nr:outer membrane protein [Helicobacter labacensis]
MSSTSRKLLTTTAFTLLSLAPLSAERNGAFAAAGFQYSDMASTPITNSTTNPNALDQDVLCNISGPTASAPKNCQQNQQQLLSTLFKNKGTYSGNLYGMDVLVGYKQFFGKKKRFGLRYYGLFSGQGGNYRSAFSPAVWGSLSNYFYGAGVDVLLNFFEKKDYVVGVFGGAMIGGSSWSMGNGRVHGGCVGQQFASSGSWQMICQNVNKQLKAMADSYNRNGNTASFSNNWVQFIFNFGLRANLSQHNGFEVGVRVPVINDPIFKLHIKDSVKVDFAFRRVIAVFANYVYNF